MVSEYRALRASVIKLWNANLKGVTRTNLTEMTRFNESIDQAMTESIRDYSEKLDRSRSLFLGILSHDLRNPLGAISMSADLTTKIGKLSDRQGMLQAQIGDSAARAIEIVTHLLDITKARLGSGLPICKEEMNIGAVGHQLIDEMRALHPDREFEIETSGELEGSWDKARMGQAISNLLGNAVQYGFTGTAICLTIKGSPNEIALCVHNEGLPIAPEAIGNIFESLTRAEPTEEPGAGGTNLGLGLYITKEIVSAHGGTIEVSSTEKSGTTFSAIFPR